MNRLISKDKNFYKTVCAIAIPIALQGLITTGVNMMDTVMVGAVGERQLSAVSLANQFIAIFHIFCMGIGMGASVLVARYFGMKEQKSLRGTVNVMLRLCLGLSLGFSVFTAFCPETIMRIYTDEADIIGYGIEYLNYSVATYFVFGLSTTCTIVLRNVGQVKIPLYTSIGAFFVNIAANYAFIFGKLGAPQMGVAGAAVGTLISRAFEFAIICGYLFIFEKEIGFKVKHIFKKVGPLWREYIRVSIPVLISDGILALGNNTAAMIISHLGGGFVAANAVTGVAQQLSTVMIQGFSQAGCIVTGKTLGEGQRQKAQNQGWAFLGIGLVFGVVAATIITLISAPLISAYDLSGETVELAKQFMAANAIIIFFQATNSIMTKGVLRGGGDTKMLMLTDNIFLWVIGIPLGLLAGHILHLPAFWFYFGLRSDQVIKAIWCVIRLKGGKWIKKIKSFE
ncbi:MAG: MATE family efflux transporter [Ruminococcaceae bacterium]|nr:MATE family efflux transporter [Oscillospiraceae bacterium]